MKYPDDARTPRTFLIICVALIALGSVPLLSSARTTSTSVTIVNSSHREVRSVYTSHVDADDWSADLLTAPIAAGQSGTVASITCDGQQVKVIGEDQDGCFISVVVSCGGSTSWTVDDNTSRDCGY